MLVNTARFGELEVQEADIIAFVSPILGFEEETAFVFVPSLEESPFQYLQSVKEENLAFVLADPFVFFPEYEFDLEEKWLEKLKLSNKEEVDIKVITTVRSSSNISINLKAPIVTNKRSNKAAQVVLERSDYPTRFSLLNLNGEEKK